MATLCGPTATHSSTLACAKLTIEEAPLSPFDSMKKHASPRPDSEHRAQGLKPEHLALFVLHWRQAASAFLRAADLRALRRTFVEMSTFGSFLAFAGCGVGNIVLCITPRTGGFGLV
eukprot:CAMPEP_0113707276 /NCGR_PEP_ID=MMETSP0038_2-20120614/28276_1 /TAXON_ID=2898 /ORGANISM="Cryptomonas paramecium" /LENGTH=116 /DNA_ID=CAMNT_0000632733 /DNA_START=247 /DNA_END=594 /DNA_ORIENTATION=- /assembly_acc=CAM_ASM_000170